MVSTVVGNFTSSNIEKDREPTPTETEKFARMLEGSSLGSEESRQARLEGARVLAGHSTEGSPWIDHAASWPDIATLHQAIADLFEGEGQSEPGELWLRAAINRETNDPAATQLAALLEQRRATKEAVAWYLRAAEMGDWIATARLAIICEFKGSREMATLLMSLGRSKLTTGRRVQANKLAGKLLKAGKRRRAKLISECHDEDLLFWVGCTLLVTNKRGLAAECYSAATIAKRNTVAALSLFDLTMSTTLDDDQDTIADARSITNRFIEAVRTEPVENVTELVSSKNRAIGDGLDVLIGEAVAGKTDAIESVLRQIRPLVMRYCHSRVGGQERSFASADDIAQEVCLAVLTALPSYRDQGRPFLAFVYGIAALKVADYRRSAARNRAEPVPGVPDFQDLADGSETQTMQEEFTGELARLMDTLPEKQREILRLRIMVGLSAEETAEAVGSTPGAVRVTQHRAVARLSQMLRSE